jgi:raffinose/stachyose/melibiose transport system permease protein
MEHSNEMSYESRTVMKRRFLYFKRENWFWHSVVSLLVGIWCLISVILFINIFVSSFKTNADIYGNPWGIPVKWITTNYINLFKDGFLVYYINSFFVLITSIFILLTVSALAAYGLAMFSFRGNKMLRSYFLLGLMFPVQLGIIPLFNLMINLHLYNNLFGLIVVYSAGVSIPIFILTNFLQNIPGSLREAAIMDGANEMQVFSSIMVPMMMPAIGALIPLTAVGIWNDFFLPLVFLTSDRVKTVPLGLLHYFTGHGFDLSKIGLVFTAVTVSILPLLLIYIFGSNKIIEGLTQGSSK